MLNCHRLSLIVLVTGLLSGCGSSPPAQFYALNSAQIKTEKLQTVSPVYIEMLPVNVPVSLSRPQIVLRQGLQLHILEQQRWAAPFNEEMRSVLAAQLSEKLGAVDVTYVGASPDKETYRISVDVQQFDVTRGQSVKGNVVWTINRINKDQPQTCSLGINIPVGQTMNDIVSGMQQATSMISTKIAEGIVTLQKNNRVDCQHLQ